MTSATGRALPEPQGNAHTLFPIALRNGTVKANEDEPVAPCGECSATGKVLDIYAVPTDTDCAYCSGTGAEQYIRCYVKDAAGRFWQVVDGIDWHNVCVSVLRLGTYTDVLVSLSKESADCTSAHVHLNGPGVDLLRPVIVAGTEAEALSEAVEWIRSGDRRLPTDGLPL